MTIEERLERKSSSPDSNGCIIWLGYIEPNGYGKITWKGKVERTHRVVWELAHGPIPKHLEIDHICENRACLHLDHLRLVTHAENMKRTRGRPQRKRGQLAIHCPRGHWYSEKNTYLYGGKRYCRECNRLSARGRRDSKKKLV